MVVGIKVASGGGGESDWFMKHLEVEPRSINDGLDVRMKESKTPNQF